MILESSHAEAAADVLRKLRQPARARGTPLRMCVSAQGRRCQCLQTILDCVTDSVEPTPVSYTSEASNLAIAASQDWPDSASVTACATCWPASIGSEITEGTKPSRRNQARYTEPLA